MLTIVTLLHLIIFFCQPFGTNSLETVDFFHETCQLQTLNSKVFETFYSTQTLNNEDGELELHVKFKGIADGHVLLASNASDEEPRYQISLGAFNNKISSIRRLKPPVEFKINTPGILTDRQYRGFVIRYDPKSGSIRVFSEGSDLPLLYLIDPEPLEIKFFSFGTWVNRVVQVAFDCQPKDSHSSFIRQRGKNSKTMKMR